MNEIRKLLCDRFYMPLPVAETGREVETCHRQLIERLEKPERKLILRIMDAQKSDCRGTLHGQFHLAFEMANEWNR